MNSRIMRGEIEYILDCLPREVQFTERQLQMHTMLLKAHFDMHEEFPKSLEEIDPNVYEKWVATATGGRQNSESGKFLMGFVKDHKDSWGNNFHYVAGTNQYVLVSLGLNGEREPKHDSDDIGTDRPWETWRKHNTKLKDLAVEFLDRYKHTPLNDIDYEAMCRDYKAISPYLRCDARKYPISFEKLMQEKAGGKRLGDGPSVDAEPPSPKP